MKLLLITLLLLIITFIGVKSQPESLYYINLDDGVFQLTEFDVATGDLTKTMMPTVSKDYSIYSILTIDSDNNFVILCEQDYKDREALVIITVSSSGEFINSTEPVLVIQETETYWFFNSAQYDAKSNIVYVGGQVNFYSEVILVYNFDTLKASVINVTSIAGQQVSGCMISDIYYLMEVSGSTNYTIDTYDINQKSLSTVTVDGLPQDTTCYTICANNQVYITAFSYETQGELSVLQIDLQTGEASKIYESSSNVVSSYNYWAVENYFTQMVQINSQYYLITIDLNTSKVVYQVEITKLFVVNPLASYLQ
ncbi:hypothetical protein DLAC_00360 [Tieghemostelium lacteum]|uniref:Uncharacterized protein n=1 Tax=Tieghemostelium lacteum TaxID=361077 RepID=A0A152A9I2_TIELA|nr:hypothetical protein DLAC_00360 [Tieghemostelium lacteum]|eukprot:KYR02883.1 hypothetical protein DLAC_00360 [Tieghemostelium lacteum]